MSASLGGGGWEAPTPAGPFQEYGMAKWWHIYDQIVLMLDWPGGGQQDTLEACINTLHACRLQVNPLNHDPLLWFLFIGLVHA